MNASPSSAALSYRWPGRLAALLSYLEYAQCGAFIAERSENPDVPDRLEESASGTALISRLDEAERLVEVYGGAVAAYEKGRGGAKAVVAAKAALRVFFSEHIK